MLPFLDGSATVTFGTGGSAAVLDLAANLAGVRFNRAADFTLSAGGGALTLGTNGLWALAPSATPRSYAVAAPVVLSAEQAWGVTNNGAGVTTLTVSGAISDGAASFGLTKSGNGLLVLAGSNSYDGATSVAAGGALRVAHDWALGSTNGVTTVTSNAWLEVGGGVSVPESLTLGDSSASGALRATDGTNVWSGGLIQVAPTRVRTLAGSRLTLAGGVTGGYNLFLSPDAGSELAVSGTPLNLGSTASARALCAYGAGTVALGTSGNTFGTLEIAGCTARAEAAGVLPAAGVLSIGASYSAAATFDLNGYDQTCSQLKRGTSTIGTRVVTASRPATLTVSGSASTVYDGSFAGALSLTKSGTSTLTFTGTNNTFSGVTTVTAGTLDVGVSASLGDCWSVAVTGGSLRLRNSNAIGSNTVVSVAGGKIRVDSGCSDVVGALYLGGTRCGPGTYGSTASAADYKNNTYFDSAGAGVLVVVSCAPGTVWDAGGGDDTRFDMPNNWDTDWPPAADGSATVCIGTGGSLATMNTNAWVRGLVLTRDADFTIAAGGGTLSLGEGGLCAFATGAVSRTYTIAAPVVLATNQAWGVTNAGAATVSLAVSGAVSDGAGSWGLAKSGEGLLVLAGSNSYDGATSVAAGGALRVAHGWALGSTNGVTTVASNAWLEVGGGVSVPESLTLGDSSVSGALRATDGTNVWSGGLVQVAPTRVRTLAGSRLTLAGGVTGGYNLLLSPDAGSELAVSGAPLNLGSTASTRVLCAYGAGTVALGASGNTFGTLEIAGCTARAEAAGVLPAAAALSIGASYSAAATFDLNGYDQTCSQLKRGTSTIGTRVVTASRPATLTVSGSTSTVYDGSFAGALSLTKSGTSTLTFTGTNNTFSGVTTVTAGTLDVGVSASLGDCWGVVVSGGTLRLRNADSIGSNAVVRISGGGKLRLDSGVETVGALYLGGVRQRRGTYGASTSGAQYKSDVYFNTSGTGVLNVRQGAGSVFSVR